MLLFAIATSGAAARSSTACTLHGPADLPVPAHGGQFALSGPGAAGCGLLASAEHAWVRIEPDAARGKVLLHIRPNDTAHARQTRIVLATREARLSVVVRQDGALQEFIRLDLEKDW